MRYLVLTDIHANLEALDACLAHAQTQHYEQVLVLGDIVGYGASPNEVIDRIIKLDPLFVIRGNHDKVAMGLEMADGFNAVARGAARWMLKTLSPEHRAWLVELPQGPIEVDEFVQICHGSPIDEDEYIFDQHEAVQALHATTRPLCLFGHTHYAITYRLRADACEALPASPERESTLSLERGSKYLINPGSVGQPRDGDPRAAYGIVDTKAARVELFRLDYDLTSAQGKILAAGLPDILARRLSIGR